MVTKRGGVPKDCARVCCVLSHCGAVSLWCCGVVPQWCCVLCHNGVSVKVIYFVATSEHPPVCSPENTLPVFRVMTARGGLQWAAGARQAYKWAVFSPTGRGMSWMHSRRGPSCSLTSTVKRTAYACSQIDTSPHNTPSREPA